ncbi:FadR/GntR family transcriptional regulator [Caproiciproducens sp.]
MHESDKKLFSEIAAVSNCGFANMLAENLAQMILRQKLPAGYVMPNENELCKILSLGRSTLREAYKVLDTLGYITRTKSGTVVNDVRSLALNGAFDTSLKLSHLEELTEFITLLEPQAAYFAAMRATPEEITEIEKEMKICALYNGDTQLLEEHNRSFHQKIRCAAHNCTLTSAIAASFSAFDEFIVKPVYRKDTQTNAFLDNCIQQHQELFDAIVSHDGERAKSIALEHLMGDIDLAREGSERA